MFAIVLAGAAGLRIGWSVVFPGESTRLAAAATSGKTAATLMVGVVLMLVVAGLLEGFGRQLIKGDIIRYAMGGGMLLLWLAFYYFPGAGVFSSEALHSPLPPAPDGIRIGDVVCASGQTTCGERAGAASAVADTQYG